MPLYNLDTFNTYSPGTRELMRTIFYCISKGAKRILLVIRSNTQVHLWCSFSWVQTKSPVAAVQIDIVI